MIREINLVAETLAGVVVVIEGQAGVELVPGEVMEVEGGAVVEGVPVEEEALQDLGVRVEVDSPAQIGVVLVVQEGMGEGPKVKIAVTEEVRVIPKTGLHLEAMDSRMDMEVSRGVTIVAAAEEMTGPAKWLTCLTVGVVNNPQDSPHFPQEIHPLHHLCDGNPH